MEIVMWIYCCTNINSGRMILLLKKTSTYSDDVTGTDVCHIQVNVVFTVRHF